MKLDRNWRKSFRVGLSKSQPGKSFSAGVYVVDGLLVDAIEGDAKPVGHLSAAYALHGEHNWQNAAAAYAAGRKLGFQPEEIFEALLSFKGLEHRQEIVGSFEGVVVRE